MVEQNLRSTAHSRLLVRDGSSDSWQEELRDAISSVADLCQRLQLPESLINDCLASEQKWALRVPVSYLAKMEIGNPKDPLLLQVLPQAKELLQVSGYLQEPLQESEQSPVNGLIHKYSGRVLMMMTGSCAVHCRYCFRREFDYSAHRLNKSEWVEALDYVAQREDISEVILSGGDPLVWTDANLAWLCRQLEGIAHVRTVRVHTRLPIVLPSRITGSLLEAFTSAHFKTVFVIHSNHANELDVTVKAALERCASAGIVLLNQSVLLAGVNDDAGSLAALSQRLFDCGVLPYYLHLLDKVNGSAHFDVSEHEARLIHQQLSSQVAGYLVPKLVREIPGCDSKQVVPALSSD